MNLSFSFAFSFYFLLLILFFGFASASGFDPSELRSLLEFKKGIKTDPFDKVLSVWDPDTQPDPTSWTGVSRDPNSGSIVSLNLDRLGLVGDLKFHTLTPLRNLQNLSLSGNAFTGRVAPALGLITSLQHLDLSDNQFVGTIPGRITDLYGLNYLNLSGNKFAGGLPGGFRNLQQLRVLDLHNNALRGDIGELLGELRNVEHVDLSYNEFYGGLSVAVENVSSLANTLRFMNLSHNQLNGGFLKEEAIGLFKNLQVLDLGDNWITGQLPSFGSLPGLHVLRLGKNQLFGPVPEELLVGFVPLEELDLNHNGFTGSIRVINSTTLKVLNLSSNQLSGDLPSSLRSCETVDLSSNMISGDISVMQNWEASLIVLDLSSNKLSGSLPNLSRFEDLNTFNLRNNSLVGTLPSLLDTCPRLSVVELSLNQLSGPIPGGLFTSTTLKNLNLSGNHFTGPIPLQSSRVNELLVMSSYPQMESLDLSNNSLTGGLPSEIGNIARLKLLSLADNELSGQLPSELSKLSNLEYLDLSGNNFKGKIPDKLSPGLNEFNVSGNDLSGPVPENLRGFPKSSFSPGNSLLIFPNGMPSTDSAQNQVNDHARHHGSKGNIRVAIIVASVVAAVMIVFVLLAYHRAQLKEFHGRSGFTETTTAGDAKLGRLSRHSLFKFHQNAQTPQTSLSFSNDHLLTSNSRSLSGQQEFVAEIVEHSAPERVTTFSASVNPNLLDNQSVTSGRKSSPGSPLPSSPRFIEACEQPVILDVYSPDRLAGELFFLDTSLAFTIEELSRAPAEVLGRGSHGTLYKATLHNGHMLTVKWLRVGLVKHKKEFAKEVKKIGSVRHPNFVPVRAYYWGPREQERLLLADYIQCDSLALHLYETTPRRYSPLSFGQRLKVAVEVAQCLLYLHDRGLPHGNLKPTNILLADPDYHACLTDYCLHRLMTPTGIAEQILNLGALGYCAPELAAASKPVPSFKADVYALGVILMELLTRRSAGDIISGQSGAVDLTDWVRLCDQEGRGMDCIDRDIASGEEHLKAMDDLLAISLRCILPVNERPNIRQVYEDLCSISL
ncbi:PREDICTED: probable inactive receptor kinase At5g10020 [Theobroma cacao]|uniref:Probable inactive receptor kinase At5g10020 n=1 Tax=Theobroma cacao TaxID=3641 RepID=A0AB32X419_THECC|nr:PREDICTED: probable inactive receptor kinase At5g10020 [Theobroma cacao]